MRDAVSAPQRDTAPAMNEKPWYQHPSAIAVLVVGIGLGVILLIAVVLPALGVAIDIIASGAATVSPLIVSAVGLIIVFMGAGVGIRVLQPVVREIPRRPFETLSPVLAAVGIVAADVTTEAAGLQALQADIFNVATGLLFVGGGFVVRRPGVIAKVLGAGVASVGPASVAIHVIATRPAEDILLAISQVETTTWLAFIFLALVMVVVVLLALATRDEQRAVDK